MSGKGDVARLFVDSCRKYGIAPGFYLGAMNNAFLNVQVSTRAPAETRRQVCCVVS